MTLDVLQVVTTPRPFFDQQVDVLERNGVSCDVLAVPGGTESKRSPMDYLKCYGSALGRGPWNYDLVHANYGLTAPIAIAQPNRPVVVSLWGSDIAGKYGQFCRRIARLADEVIVVTPTMAAKLDCPCHVIPHGIDLSLFEPLPTAKTQQTVGWDTDSFHVIFPYAPDREVKNYPRAEAIVDAVDARLEKPVTLEVVYGVAHEQLPIYMNAANALLLTSKREGSPNAVREALACNTPVVATDVGDVRSWVEDTSVSTVGTDDADLIEGLVAALTTETAPDGRKAVEPVSLSRMGDRLKAVYDSALRG